ncbi:Tat pathway signal sequence domain protein [Oesophagostomum dentatum]|uniref:Tat pathway signal sequence domain protein n=1 Tax=Oesophagostomum dentatum TaxID=61180 RepID=A0A0B1T450_OESDE|nr:Tat pathway signal sequence domain protein [Oesophagostomum dentatum]
MIIKIAPGDEDSPELVRVRKLHVNSPEEILKELGLLNSHSIFIMLSMGFLWCLSAMPTMSPAYLAPPHSMVNSSYVSVQSEFHLQKTVIDPAELTSSVYFLGNLLLGQIYCMAADRIGRRPVLVWSLIVAGLAGIGSSLAPTFYLMLLGRFIQGSFFNKFVEGDNR